MSKPVRKLNKKVCLLGDFSVGKTSLVRRFVEGRFDERYLSTIGVKVDRKAMELETDGGTVALTLMLWDLAGGPDIGPVVPSYYRGAAGAVIACDLTRPETVAGTSNYAEGIMKANPRAFVVMAANKVDLVEERRVTDEELAAKAAEHGARLFLTSAKTGEQVEAMFEHLGTALIG
jgi:small GTP-binding protein